MNRRPDRAEIAWLLVLCFWTLAMVLLGWNMGFLSALHVIAS